MPRSSTAARRASSRCKDPWFPSFLRLPSELRMQIWECYCPVLVASHRLWDIEFGFCGAEGCCQDWAPRLPKTYPREVLIMSAVHRESRRIMKQAFPDCLPLHPPGSVLHFDQNNDVVLLENAPLDEYPTSSLQTFLTTGSHVQVRHLALGLTMLEQVGPLFLDAPFGNPAVLSNLRTLYVAMPEDYCLKDRIAWCATDGTARFEKKGESRAIDKSITYCWPIVPITPADSYELPDALVSDYILFARAVILLTLQLSQFHIAVLPMVFFPGKRGMASLYELRDDRNGYEEADMRHEDKDKDNGEFPGHDTDMEDREMRTFLGDMEESWGLGFDRISLE